MTTQIILGDYFPQNVFGDLSNLSVIARSLGLETTDSGLRQHSKFWTIGGKHPDVPENFILISYVKDMLSTISNNEIINEKGEKEQLFTDLGKKALLKLRGVVYDLNNKIICGASLGYNPVVSIPAGTEDIPKLLTDAYGNNYYDLEGATFQPKLEGTILKFWMIDGYRGISTNKSIYTGNSSWGNSELFTDIYKRLGGPTHDELFSSTASNLTHFFLIVHPTLSSVTQNDMGDGYLVYLGFRLNNMTIPNVDDIYSTDYDSVELTTSSYKFNGRTIANNSIIPPPSSKNETNLVYELPVINKDQAINYLNNGSHTDLSESLNKMIPLFQCGEAVIMTLRDGTMLTLSSQSYNHRTAIHCGNNNLLNQAFKFYDLCVKLEGDTNLTNFNGIDKPLEEYGSYWNLFPFVATPKVNEFNQLLKIPEGELLLEIPTNFIHHKKNDLNNPKLPDDYRLCRLSNALICFYMIVPLHSKKEAAGFYKLYIERFKMIYDYIDINWDKFIDSFINKKEKPDNSYMFSDLPWKKNNKSTPAARTLYRLIEQTYVYTKNDKFLKKSFRETALKNVYNLLCNEKGTTLYQLSTAIMTENWNIANKNK